MAEKAEGLGRASRAGLESRHSTRAQGGEKVIEVTLDHDLLRPLCFPARTS